MTTLGGYLFESGVTSKKRSPRTVSMIMTRQLLGYATIFHGQLHAGTGFQLSHGTPIEFLPWRLAGRYRRQSLFLATRQFLCADQHIATTGIQIDTNTVAAAQIGESTADRTFR